MCATPSPETTVSSTGRFAGEDTVGGFRPPPERIVNVAGTRAFVEPVAGAEWDALADAPPDELPGGATGAPPDGRALDVPPDAVALADELEPRPALVDGVALTDADAVAVDDTVPPADTVALELALWTEEPPHPATSATTTTITTAKRITT